MNNWISVKDKLPIESGDYLVTVVDPDYPNNKFIDIDIYHQNSNLWDKYQIEWCPEQVTHWMPLPQLPGTGE